MKCQYSQLSATGFVKQGISAYHGYIVVTAVATASILVRDGGASGLVLDTIPATTAAGITRSLSYPIATNSSLFFDLNGGTGTVNVLYE